MKKPSFALRIGFAIAALTVAIAMALHIQNWQRGAAFNLPTVTSMSGLTILMSISAIDLRRGLLRVSLAAIALLLIFGGSSVQIATAFLH